MADVAEDLVAAVVGGGRGGGGGVAAAELELVVGFPFLPLPLGRIYRSVPSVVGIH